MPESNGIPGTKRSHNDAFGGDQKITSIYKNTDVSAGGLRLLSLHGGTTPVLRGNLVLREDVLLEDGSEPSYSALSYTWGNSEKTSHLEILTGGYAHDLPITSNLEAALLQLRHENNPGSHRLLWIDAVCINQEDKFERNAQVRRMGKIFGEAQQVIVWVGKEEGGSSKALNFIHRVLDLDSVSSLAQDISCVDDWAALFQLLRRPWFSRRWVIQEIALAQEATLHCGNSSLSWEKFADAVSLFASKHNQLQELFKKSSAHNHNADYLGDVNELGAVRLIHVSNNLFRKSNKKGTGDPMLSLETLVSMLPSFDALKAEDTIFAVLSLAADVGRSSAHLHSEDHDSQSEMEKDVEPSEQPHTKQAMQRAKSFIGQLRQKKDDRTYPVDVGKPFYQVCKDFLMWTTKRSKSLDIICRPWAPTKTGEALPSWIPTLAGLSFRPDGKGVSRRVRADSLVGMPDGKKNYDASKNYPSNWTFGQGQDERKLFIEGFVLDTIGIKKLPAQSGNVPFEWLIAGGWKNTREPPPEPFWRTLVADRGPDQKNPPSYYRLACKHAYAMGVEGDDLKTDRGIAEGCPDIVAEFLRRVQSVVWYRCLVVTREQELLGLVPYDATPSDLICILHGCSVPVVLRQRKDETTLRLYYEFIGECYVHSMMDGSAFRVRDEKLLREQKQNSELKTLVTRFELR